MNGAIYLADLIGGQKTGLFYDQRPNHAFAARLAAGQEVLDIFAHVGGLSRWRRWRRAPLRRWRSTARSRRWRWPGRAPRRWAPPTGSRPASGDAFRVMDALAHRRPQLRSGGLRPAGLRAANRQALDAGLRAYERVARQAAGLVAPGGYLVLCSCSHAADLTQFRAACTRGIGKAGRSGQIVHTGFAGPDHPLLPQLAESGYLKALFFRLTP